MSAIESDPDRYGRMSARAAGPTPDSEDAPFSAARREAWPVPTEVRGASARDAFLWYIADGWQKIFGESEPIETLFDHDFGMHVMRKGSWQITLVDTDQFPDSAWPGEETAA